MKICAFSDMHGNLNFNIDACDLVLICGDIVPLGVQSSTHKSRKWLKDTFIPWCNNLPCDKVVLIGGNHDMFLYMHGKEFFSTIGETNEKIVYLECEFYEYKGKRIFGSPLCKIFGNWYFMYSYQHQDEVYDKVVKENENKIDILVTHDAPYGVSDVCLQEDCYWVDGSHIGNDSLYRFVNNLGEKAPSILVHGHLHSSNHEKEYLNSTEVYNVSLLNENYDLVYEPKYFEL